MQNEREQKWKDLLSPDPATKVQAFPFIYGCGSLLSQDFRLDR